MLFYFRFILDFLMEREFNTPRITAKLYYTYFQTLTHGTYKLSDSEFKTPQISPILQFAKIKHFTVDIVCSLTFTILNRM